MVAFLGKEILSNLFYIHFTYCCLVCPHQSLVMLVHQPHRWRHNPGLCWRRSLAHFARTLPKASAQLLCYGAFKETCPQARVQSAISASQSKWAVNILNKFYSFRYSWVNLVIPKNWAAYFSAISGRKFDLAVVLRSCWPIEWHRRGFIASVPFFSLLIMRKTTFQWSEVVSEAIFPTNLGYVSIEKWS